MFFQSKKFIYHIGLGYSFFFLNWLFIYYRHPFYNFPLQSLDFMNILYILNFLLGCAFLPFIIFIILNFGRGRYKECLNLIFHYLSLDCALAYFFELYTGMSTFFLRHPYYLKGAFIYTFSISWGVSFCILLFNYLKEVFFEDKPELLNNEIEKKKLKENYKNLKKNLFINEKSELLPNIDLLSIGKKNKISIDTEKEKELLLKTLNDFGITAIIKDVFVGPVITLYSIELAPGIKASRVISLSMDIARLMTAFSVRISTVPGKNLLGVEISNPKRQMVYFKEGIISDKYLDFNGNLPIYLGANIFGEPEVFDLSLMPHLLVAGTTGSGKSVGIHTILLSLLFSKTFKEVRFILVDPKKLELTPYEDIPHLLLPVVTEPQKAVQALNWAVKEMERRYNLMSKIGVRNINSFNEKINKSISSLDLDQEDKKCFEYIVIIIDELADLMLLVGKEFEICVQRLAQMGRASGIHMIIATQRPSVDVITGTIKANFPTRISFKLSSKIDSRTILGDMSGAEQLLGSGDMLYLGMTGKITRIHGSYVSEDDVRKVVSFLKKQAEPEYIDLSFYEAQDLFNVDGGVEDEPYYLEAVKLINHEKKVSTSFLQRSFPIGYNRAASIIERMEKEFLITKGDRFGRNREVLQENMEKLIGKF